MGVGSKPLVSVIVPVRNGAPTLSRCLTALAKSQYSDYERIVVDDASEDDSADITLRHGGQLVSLRERCGPAAARNLGAARARGAILFFIDADCEVHPDTLEKMTAVLRSDPQLAAVFGSYDNQPEHLAWLSQYKNLSHHYVHQTSQRSAATFWAGCGAVRRDAFFAVGGFDAARYPRPSIEDIDLGYRLYKAGYHIMLVPEIQVRHLKRWTLLSLIKTDVFARAIPWMRLMLRRRLFRADLNLQTGSLASTLFVVLFVVGWIPAALGWIPAWALILLGGGYLALNRQYLGFFYRERGFLFMLFAISWYMFTLLYSVVGAILGVLAWVFVDHFQIDQ